MRRPAEAFIGSTKLVVSGGHSAPFHTGIPVDIGDIRIVYDVDVSDIGGVDVRVIPISTAKPSAVEPVSPPRMENFKRSQGHPTDSAPTNSDTYATPAEETDQSRTPEI